MSCKLYAEHVFHFSYVLDGTFFTFYQVNHAAGPTISSGFNSEFFASGSAAKCNASFDVGTDLATRLFILVILKFGGVSKPQGEVLLRAHC